MTDADDPIALLNDLLQTDDLPDSTMDVSMLDGLIAAALCGPGGLSLDALRPWIGDMNHGAQPLRLADPDAQAAFDAALQQHWESTAAVLAAQPERYEPVIFLSDDDDDPDAPAVSVIDEWCWGFMLGMRLQPGAFDQLPDAVRELLTPIALYGTEAGWEQLDRIPISPEQHEEIAESLPAIVAALHHEFHA